MCENGRDELRCEEEESTRYRRRMACVQSVGDHRALGGHRLMVCVQSVEDRRALGGHGLVDRLQN